MEMPGIEPGAFHMQSERSTTEPHPRRPIWTNNCVPRLTRYVQVIDYNSIFYLIRFYNQKPPETISETDRLLHIYYCSLQTVESLH